MGALTAGAVLPSFSRYAPKSARKKNAVQARRGFGAPLRACAQRTIAAAMASTMNRISVSNVNKPDSSREDILT